MQKKLFATLVAFLGLASAVFGQNAGTITGRVVDQTAAVVAGAEVKVTDVSTGEEQKTTTNDTGLYFFNTIRPGTYDVSIEKAGFRKAQFTKQTVEIGSALTLNVSLEVGASTQTVTVEAEAGAQLETLSSTVGQPSPVRRWCFCPISVAMLPAWPFSSPAFPPAAWSQARCPMKILSN